MRVSHAQCVRLDSSVTLSPTGLPVTPGAVDIAGVLALLAHVHSAFRRYCGLRIVYHGDQIANVRGTFVFAAGRITVLSICTIGIAHCVRLVLFL